MMPQEGLPPYLGKRLLANYHNLVTVKSAQSRGFRHNAGPVREDNFFSATLAGVVGFVDMNTFTILKLALAAGLTVAVAFINAELALAILAAAGVIAIMLHDYSTRRVPARSGWVA